MTDRADVSESRGDTAVAIGEIAPILRLGLEAILRGAEDLSLAASGLPLAALAPVVAARRIDAVVLPQDLAPRLAQLRQSYPRLGVALLLDRRDFEAPEELAALAAATCIKSDAVPFEVRAALLLAASHPALAAAESRAKGERRSRAASPLTPREFEMLALLAEGLTRHQIAARLNISKHTVDSHLRGLFAKLGVSSRHELLHILPRPPDVSLP